MEQTVNTASLVIPIANLTGEQIETLIEMMRAKPKTSDMSDLVAGAKKGASKKKAAPVKTVSPDEDEDYGTSGDLTDEELEVEEEDEKPVKRKAASKKVVEEDEEEEEESDDDAPSIEFDEVRAAINKLGNRDASAMKTILASFNLKTAKEVERHPKKYEAIYRKVMTKLKAGK